MLGYVLYVFSEPISLPLWFMSLKLITSLIQPYGYVSIDIVRQVVVAAEPAGRDKGSRILAP